jgi:hypothetical protein
MASDIKKGIAVVDDGTREIPIVNTFGQEICKIYFRPSDVSIIDRYNHMMSDFDALVEPLKSLSLNNDGTATFEKDWQTLKRVESDLIDKINILFDMEDAGKIFSTRNPFSSVGGQFYCLRVLRALETVVTDAVEEEVKLSHQRMAKYLTDDDQSEAATEVSTDAGAVAEKS